MFSGIKKWAVGCAGEYAKDYLTVQNIEDWIIQLVNNLLAKATHNVEPEKMDKICKTIGDVSDLCAVLSRALADKVITTTEAAMIMENIQKIIGESGIDDAKIASFINNAVATIKEKI